MDTSRVQEAQMIIGRFVPPEKLYKNVLLVYNGEGDNRTYTFVGIAEVDTEVMKTAVASLDRNQQGVISSGASERISVHYGKDVRYSLHPLQRSYNLIHSSGREGKRFKEYVMVSSWVHNLERFRKPNLLFPDSYDYADGERFSYEGEPKKVNFEDGKIISALVRAKVFKQPKQKVNDWDIGFDDSDESSVRSYWHFDENSCEGCFLADSARPSSRDESGVAVFGETDQRVKVETVTVPKRAYEIEVAARRAAIEELKQLKERMDAAKERLSY